MKYVLITESTERFFKTDTIWKVSSLPAPGSYDIEAILVTKDINLKSWTSMQLNTDGYIYYGSKNNIGRWRDVTQVYIRMLELFKLLTKCADFRNKAHLTVVKDIIENFKKYGNYPSKIDFNVMNKIWLKFML